MVGEKRILSPLSQAKTASILGTWEGGGCVQRGKVCRGEFRITVDARRDSMMSTECYGETCYRIANDADVMRRRIRTSNEREPRIA